MRKMATAATKQRAARKQVQVLLRIAQRDRHHFPGEEGPERKFSSFAAVRTRGLHRSVNLRSGQRDSHNYIAGRSIRP